MFKKILKGENLNMKDVDYVPINTLRATQHTMLKIRPELETIKNLLCDQVGENKAIGQRKFKYKDCFRDIFE